MVGYVATGGGESRSGDLQVATGEATLKNGTGWQTWWRKRNRLARDVYCGPAAFAVTVTTWQRQPTFTDAMEARRYRKMLGDAALSVGFSLLAYCFMPDHLHLLVQGSEGSDLSQLMKRFKQASSFDYRRRVGRALWQRGYYDHVVRGYEELLPAVEYVLGNPVRAGLVESPGAYPFSGGELAAETLVAT
jgi:putative transposase